MALRRCRECGVQVSTEAEVCPHCGVRSPTASNPIANLGPSDATKRGRGPFTAIMVVVVLCVLAVLYAKNPNQTGLSGLGGVGSGPEGWVILFIFLVIYFAPTINAWTRHHRNTTAITVLNIFLGWTFIGWVVALVWSYSE
jgi:uncharacterized integral membrane protein